ncbi:MAG: M23 family metallopeptidase [Nitrospirae bacterium]|nr:M23 family metallopeptidase [Nitrospirota bacterium]
MQPKEVIPGDVFVVKVQVGNDSSSTPGFPQAEFLGSKISFFQDAKTIFMALIPVDIGASPGKYPVTVTFKDEKKAVLIRVKPHKFPTQKITLPEEKVMLGPEDLKRAEREREILNNILSQYTARIWDGHFITPTDTVLSEEFGVTRIMNNKRNSIHRGVDYKGDMGTPVRAVNSGKVVLRDELFFGGRTLVIDHGTGLFSIYMHLSEFRAAQGEKVSRGQLIGLAGMSGRATGPHLHMGVKLIGVNVNPVSLFRLKL